jgi:Ca2+-binding EF-hand superfamily protein
MKNLLMLLAVAAIAMVFTSCSTTSKTSAAPDRFAEADTNHDGKLSPQEASDFFVTSIFDSRDLNRDGKLTWDEWNVPGAGRSKAKFESADTDKDGSLSLDEAKAYGRKRGLFKKEFQEADSNHDGFVTREEAKAYSASKEGPPR